MKLLLDEMWSPGIALQLRRRGHDVVAVAERRDLRGQHDPVVFSIAQGEGRAIVTENVADYRPLAADAQRLNQPHAGVIFTSNRRFPRSNPRTNGRLVTALDRLVRDETETVNREHWLA